MSADPSSSPAVAVPWPTRSSVSRPGKIRFSPASTRSGSRCFREMPLSRKATRTPCSAAPAGTASSRRTHSRVQIHRLIVALFPGVIRSCLRPTGAETKPLFLRLGAPAPSGRGRLVAYGLTALPSWSVRSGSSAGIPRCSPPGWRWPWGRTGCQGGRRSGPGSGRKPRCPAPRRRCCRCQQRCWPPWSAPPSALPSAGS